MTSAPLILEYVVDGPQRGYQFTSPTAGYSDDVLKAIWRGAMPRGQGWAAYVGAESLKCFPLPGGLKWCASRVSVTDQADESGRRGIRRAVIETVPLHALGAHLRAQIDALPHGVQDDAEAQIAYWGRVRALDALAGKIRKAGQLALAHPYTTPADWRFAEAVALRLALHPTGALKPLGAGRLAFTTLALTALDESPLVALPADRALNPVTAKGAPVPLLRI
jgi:hypothetical protein